MQHLTLFTEEILNIYFANKDLSKDLFGNATFNDILNWFVEINRPNEQTLTAVVSLAHMR